MLSQDRLNHYLNLTDLTTVSGHAHQRVIERLRGAMEKWTGLKATTVRKSPIVHPADNYDALQYPADAVARSARYSHYLSDDTMLRTHTSAMLPEEIAKVADHGEDRLWVAPGLVYRRDVVDRTHVGEPHQVDLWTVQKKRLGRADMIAMIEAVLTRITPGTPYRLNETHHPYTVNGLEVEIEWNGRWLEVLECGEVHPWILEDRGLCCRDWSGLAMGLGVDRLVMMLKGIDDIRLLRSQNPKVLVQMMNLERYREVSKHQPTKRDMSICLADPDMEVLGDRMRDILGEEASLIEEVSLIEATPYDRVPEIARERLGMSPGQTNTLIRVVLRSLDCEIKKVDGNALYEKLYRALHEGTAGYA